MPLTPEARKKLQWALTACLVIAAARTGYILYERHEANKETVIQEAPPLKADYYVTPRKLRPYDLESAKQLTRQPVWVREGYRFTFFPYNPARHRSDFDREAGLLLPLQRLEIKDVVTDITPGAPDQRQLMAAFEKDGKNYAFPIGSMKEGNYQIYQIYSDDMLFIQDPHELYKHWPADVWASIDKHEVKPGMSVLQTIFSIGMATTDPGGDSYASTMHFPNGGNPLKITFRNDKASEITPEK
jgi:hypothetical protein